MPLTATHVSKCLDKKLLIFGYEIPDLLVIFLTMSILNFIFGQSSFKLFLIWIPTGFLAAILRFGKRGKPDNYLVHWIRFQFRPGTLSAFPSPNQWKTPPNFKEVNSK